MEWMQQRHSTPEGGVPYPVEDVDDTYRKCHAGGLRWQPHAIMRKGKFVQSVAKMPQYGKTKLRLIFLMEGFRDGPECRSSAFFLFLPWIRKDEPGSGSNRVSGTGLRGVFEVFAGG
jgi:hypothetical protein